MKTTMIEMRVINIKELLKMNIIRITYSWLPRNVAKDSKQCGAKDAGSGNVIMV